jgi:hypothetical protein
MGGVPSPRAIVERLTAVAGPQTVYAYRDLLPMKVSELAPFVLDEV